MTKEQNTKYSQRYLDSGQSRALTGMELGSILTGPEGELGKLGSFPSITGDSGEQKMQRVEGRER